MRLKESPGFYFILWGQKFDTWAHHFFAAITDSGPWIPRSITHADGKNIPIAQMVNLRRGSLPSNVTFFFLWFSWVYSLEICNVMPCCGGIRGSSYFALKSVNHMVPGHRGPYFEEHCVSWPLTFLKTDPVHRIALKDVLSVAILWYQSLLVIVVGLQTSATCRPFC